MTSTLFPSHELPELPACEEPAARFQAHGPAALSDSELLAVACGVPLGTGQNILREIGNLGRLLGLETARLEMIDGIGPKSAERIVALGEIYRRAMSSTDVEPVMNRPEVIASFMRPRIVGLKVEKFWALLLNRKNRLIRCVEITSGTATAALAHPREVFRAACIESAAAVVCVHNHPSGDPAPSAADIQVTRAIRTAGNALDIQLLDHVICGEASADPLGKGHYSFREMGIL